MEFPKSNHLGLDQLYAQLQSIRDRQDPLNPLDPTIQNLLKSTKRWRQYQTATPKDGRLTKEATHHEIKRILEQIDRHLKKLIPQQLNGIPEGNNAGLVREIRHIVQNILLQLRDQTPKKEQVLLQKIDGIIAGNGAAMKKEIEQATRVYHKSDQRIYKEFTKAQERFQHELKEANTDLKIKTYQNRVWKGEVSFAPAAKEENWQVQETRLGSLQVGIASTQGRRSYNEDYMQWGRCGPKGQSSFMALFDGHGGSECAAFLQNSIANELNAKLQKIENLTSPERELEITHLLKHLFVYLDKEFKNKHPHSRAGSTAILALVIDQHLYLVNVGDSRAILVKEGSQTEKIMQLTDDAKPDKERFKKGIVKRGGRVITPLNSVPRVNGILAVARSVGDARVGKGVTSLGKVSRYALSDIPPGSRLVLATDGVWDVGSTEEVGHDLAAANGSSSDLALHLIKSAYASGSGDNISAFVATF